MDAMTDWASLTDAYGPADAIPVLLDALTDEDIPELWDSLWERLCHDGIVHGASYAALPQLAAMARARPASGFVEPLLLGAAIVSADDAPLTREQVRTQFADEIAALHRVARRNVGFADDPVQFVYALQVLVGLDEVPVWRTHLHVLADGGFEALCPSCEAHLFITLDADGATASTDPDGASATTRLSSANPIRLTEAERGILALAERQPQVASAFLQVAGGGMCPACGVWFAIPDALVAGDRLA